MQNLRMIIHSTGLRGHHMGNVLNMRAQSGASSCGSSSQSGSKDNCEPPCEHAVCKARYFSAVARCEQG